jgi:hypothetical protein
VGYRYEDKATVVKDIDEQVRGAVSLLFSACPKTVFTNKDDVFYENKSAKILY